MPNTHDAVYEFGEFVLDPQSRLLTHFGKAIQLAAKDLDILLYLVERPDQFVTVKDLIDNIWGGSETIRYSNITNHISKIRKALNDDANRPTFIKTYHSRKVYRFIAGVTTGARNAEAPIDAASSTHKLTSHLFVPVYCGRATYEKLVAPHKESQWGSYKEFAIDDGRLCVLPSGVGVWHLTEQHEFETMSDVAAWRRRTYDKILGGRHRIAHFKKLFEGLSEDEDRIFGAVWQAPSYVFSFLILVRSPFRNEVQITKLLEILSCLTPLEQAVARSAGSKDSTDTSSFASGGESVPIGSPGEHRGFANWDSVSFQAISQRASSTSDEIVELEIALQATWWLAKCLNSALLTGEINKADLRDAMSDLTRQYARLQTVGTTELPALLKVSEAILATSRIERLVNETFRLYGNL